MPKMTKTYSERRLADAWYVHLPGRFHVYGPYRYFCPMMATHAVADCKKQWHTLPCEVYPADGAVCEELPEDEAYSVTVVVLGSQIQCKLAKRFGGSPDDYHYQRTGAQSGWYRDGRFLGVSLESIPKSLP